MRPPADLTRLEQLIAELSARIAAGAGQSPSATTDAGLPLSGLREDARIDALRDALKDLAAQMAVQTARREGPSSPIPTIVDVARDPAQTRATQASIAQRIRALLADTDHRNADGQAPIAPRPPQKT